MLVCLHDHPLDNLAFLDTRPDIRKFDVSRPAGQRDVNISILDAKPLWFGS